MRHVSDSERRARLARRHAVAAAYRVGDVEAATRAMVVLHATDAPAVHLSAAARVDALTRADVDHALTGTRTLVKQLAMRRTVFVFPRDLLPAGVGSAGLRVAATERARLVKDVVAGGLAVEARAAALLVETAEQAVERRLAGGVALTTRQLGMQVPELAGRVTSGAGTKWESSDPFGPRVLVVLGAGGRIVRGENELHWRQPRYRWASMEHWLGGPLELLSPEQGWAELTRRWLRSFGPGTEADLVWWLGSTKTAVRLALATVEAVPVTLDGGQTAYVLPDDVEPEPAVEPWAALLPTLDPTTMGWRGRDFYLDPALVPYLFDRAGNAVPTAWWCGRVVGTWVQDAGGAVRVVTHADLPREARRALDAEAGRLTAWLGEERVTHVYAAKLAAGARIS